MRDTRFSDLEPDTIALVECLMQCFGGDNDGRELNVVDGLFAIARALEHIAKTQEQELEHLEHGKKA